MASRYWRIVAVETYGYRANLALAGLGLYESGTRVDAGATLTSTAAPISGALSNLQDADTATTAVFDGAAVASPGFALVWDFGAGNDKDISSLRFWGTADAQSFAYGFALQDSSDGQNWSNKSVFLGIPSVAAGAYVDAKITDSYLQNTVLFINGNGSIADGSVYGRAVTANGNAQVSTSIKKHGTGSVAFDGSGDKLTVASSADFAFGVGDYTIELWVMRGAGGQAYARAVNFGPYWASDDAHGINVSDPDVGGKLAYASYKLGAARLLASSTKLDQGVWYHVAVTRAAGVFRLFLDGVLQATNSSHVGASIDVSSNNWLAIGSAEPVSGGEDFSGYIDDLRVTKGVARYTGNFTPPGEFAGTGYTPAPRLMPVASMPAGRWNFETVGNTVAAVNGAPQAQDLEDWGPFRIVGTVKEKATPTNTPLRRRVRLHNETSGRMVRETWSDAATGAYSFDYVRGDQTYFVVAFDHLHNYRAVIADNLAPEAMP